MVYSHTEQESRIDRLLSNPWEKRLYFLGVMVKYEQPRWALDQIAR